MKNKIINYYLNGNSINKTCRKYKIGVEKLNNILLENNIKKRSRGDGLKLARDKNPDKFKHSEETKKKLSEIRKKYLKENGKEKINLFLYHVSI